MFRYPLTDNTELRLLEPRHLDEVYAVTEENRAYLRRWMAWVDKVSSAQDIFLPRTNLAKLGDNGNFAAGIWHHGRFSGVIGIHDIDWQNRRTSLGYWLVASCQRHGIMTRACQAVISHLFGTLQLQRIEIRAASGNLRSQGVARRLGFRHEGTLRKTEWLADGMVDHMVFAMLREEWQHIGERLAFSCPLMEDAELRMLMPHYAEEIFSLIDGNRAYLRSMSWLETTSSVGNIRDFIRRSLHHMTHGTQIQWGIWHAGRFAGVIGTLPINQRAGCVELGYWLGEEFQGKGLVTNAARAMLTYVFATLNLHRAELRILTDNQRSRAVAERLGFVLEGIQRHAVWSNGKLMDLLCFGLLREEWESNQL